MAQTGKTPIQLYGSTTAGNTPLPADLATDAEGVELAVNAEDGKLFYKDTGGTVRVLATAAGAAGDVVGPASATDNALARFDAATGKLIQNSSALLSDSGILSGLANVSTNSVTANSVSSGVFIGPLTGNASTATALQTPVTLWGQSFNGAANVSGSLTGVTDLTASGVIAGKGGLLPRVVVIADATSITLNSDTTDLATQGNTQGAGTLTLNAPAGTPSNGQKLMLRVQSTNVQTFSWNAAFGGSTDLPLPTASSGSSKYDYLGFIYNSGVAKWQLVAKNFGF